jgi:hypothetical protein
LAALKDSLDKFSDTINGFPVELETDCQALRDTIINNKSNSAHARWLDGIMGHHIIDCRHRPGRLNQAADGISRQFTDAPVVEGDGHEWSVDPDWASSVGLAYDIWTTQLDSTQIALRERFVNEPIFLDVIDAMYNLDHGNLFIHHLLGRRRGMMLACGSGVGGWEISGHGRKRSRRAIEESRLERSREESASCQGTY